MIESLNNNVVPRRQWQQKMSSALEKCGGRSTCTYGDGRLADYLNVQLRLMERPTLYALFRPPHP